MYVHILDSRQVYKHILMFQTYLKIQFKISITKLHVNNVFLTKWPRKFSKDSESFENIRK